jgi:hypothetical protein
MKQERAVQLAPNLTLEPPTPINCRLGGFNLSKK